MRKFSSDSYKIPTFGHSGVYFSFYISRHKIEMVPVILQSVTNKKQSVPDVPIVMLMLYHHHTCMPCPNRFKMWFNQFFFRVPFFSAPKPTKRCNQPTRPFHGYFHFTKKSKNNCRQKATCVIYCPLRFVIAVSVFQKKKKVFPFYSAGVVCFSSEIRI